MSTTLSTSLQIFIQKLEGLKDWPDKNVILELTAITEQNIGFAEHFANILMARLTSEQTHASYKLPMFYLIDAIMKHVGGPFANLFSTKFSEGYTRALIDLHQKDREKLKFLMDTWDERSFMTFELIRKMKALLDTPASHQPLIQPLVSHQVPLKAPLKTPLNVPIVPPPVYNRPKPVSAVPAPVAAKFTPIPAPADFRAPPSAAVVSSGAVASTNGAAVDSAMFADIVQNEMVSMLNQMYAEMNVTNPMSLDELARANASLFAQIKGKAEEAARVIVAKRGVAGSPVVRGSVVGSSVGGGVGGGVGGRYGSGYDDVTGRKRTAPINPSTGSGARNYSNTNNSDYYNDYYAAPSSNYQQYTSRYNTSSNNSSANNTTQRYNQSSPYNTTHSTHTNPTADRRIPTTNLHNDMHSAHPNTTHTTSHTTSHVEEEMLSKYASDYFVNGFLCEVPVVVDVARVQALRDVLQSKYGKSDSNTVGGSPTGFDAASEGVVKRLHSYLQDVQVPPRLPQMLFGPLPLRPIYAPSAEATEELNNKNKINSSAGGTSTSGSVKEKVQTKLPVPPFRTEELGRNPETHIAALYHNKPHQFHEDGLRFATLALLTQHTDKFIQMKKLTQKKGSVREYREWYCSTAQWVTDFNSKSASGTSGGSGTSSGGVVSISNKNTTNTNNTNTSITYNSTNDNVEYVVQADEHFTRCPVSRETFECVWDEQEGEMLYRNAVKVLVTSGADPALYALAQTIPWLDGAGSGGGVKYLIVHKTLVLDAWLSTGKAVPLADAITRYKASSTAVAADSSGVSKAELLGRAVGEDDDEEDLFVLLEFA